MQVFWELVVAPLIECQKPKVIWEIGSDSGVNTLELLTSPASSERTLHSIDPRPLFDTALLSSPSDFTELLKNARDHASADVQLTVQAFGPCDWSDGLGGTS